MYEVRFESWQEGCDKVGMDLAIRDLACVGLADAHRTVQSLLEGEQPSIPVPSREAGIRLVETAERLGVAAALHERARA
jgi:hypothetical protein